MKQTFSSLVPIGNGLKLIDYNPAHCIGGDTDSCYLDIDFLNGKSQQEIVSIADQIGDEVNVSFLPFVVSAFNVDSERAKIIASDREAVSDGSVFFARKKYIMHLVNNEGVDVDKMKTMGLEIKKTDTPKIIQDFLMSIVMMILEDKKYDEIKEYIERFKKDYHSMSMLEIGKPSNIKNFDKYYLSYLLDGSTRGFPYHVTATIFYNTMCSDSDVKIRAGDKIKIIYINHPEASAIAIPSDADRLPDWLSTLEIDWKKQWETVESKIEIYLAPVGMDKTSRQQTLTQSLVQF